MTIPAWLSWIIVIIRAWLGIEADIKQKQQEHVGEVMQQNTNLKASVAAEEAALKADANAPVTKAEKLQALEEGRE